jgi:hypothetical protein
VLHFSWQLPSPTADVEGSFLILTHICMLGLGKPHISLLSFVSFFLLCNGISSFHSHLHARTSPLQHVQAQDRPSEGKGDSAVCGYVHRVIFIRQPSLAIRMSLIKHALTPKLPQIWPYTGFKS